MTKEEKKQFKQKIDEAVSLLSDVKSDFDEIVGEIDPDKGDKAQEKYDKYELVCSNLESAIEDAESAGYGIDDL